MQNGVINPASFRDPAGFVFNTEAGIYRQVNKAGQADYDLFIASGLYDHLASSKSIVPHEEVGNVIYDNTNWYRTLRPLQLGHISYPREWCFSQLKDAALLTLSIAIKSLEYGMLLKDATPANIQFLRNSPILIDTLSFEKYDEHSPWVAYRQFCNTFLFPLLAEHYTGVAVHRLFAAFPGGLAVEDLARLLPLRARFSLSCWLHVFLPRTIERKPTRETARAFSKTKMLHLLHGLKASVSSLKSTRKSHWSSYYEPATTAGDYLQAKQQVFRGMLAKVPPGTALDLGTNSGLFAMIMAGSGFDVIATDNDAASIEALYTSNRMAKANGILPLIIDAISPTPAEGFMLSEQPSFFSRFRFDLVVALALVHHLAISRNVPLARLSAFFAGIAPMLIIEFVPKNDPKVAMMLDGRKDIFVDYNKEAFEAAFAAHFYILESTDTPPTDRRIYLMKKK